MQNKIDEINRSKQSATVTSGQELGRGLGVW